MIRSYDCDITGFPSMHFNSAADRLVQEPLGFLVDHFWCWVNYEEYLLPIYCILTSFKTLQAYIFVDVMKREIVIM